MTPTGWYLLGVPWDCSGTSRGEERAPAALRAAGLAELVEWDLGDLPISIQSTHRDPRTGVLALPETVHAAALLTDALAEALAQAPADVPVDASADVPIDGPVGALGEAPSQRKRPLLVGGDCSLLLGVFPALGRSVGPVGLWFVDGHPDYLDGTGSDTGETADMDLALLTGTGAAELAGPEPLIAFSDVVLLGHRTRDLDRESRREVAGLPPALRRIDAGAVLADPAQAGARAVDWLAEAGKGVWLHVDLDVLDPASLPAVTYPQAGGPDWDQLATLLRPLAGSPRLLGVSVADFRPDLDPDGSLARRIVGLLADVLP